MAAYVAMAIVVLFVGFFFKRGTGPKGTDDLHMLLRIFRTIFSCAESFLLRAWVRAKWT